jgi:ABC-type multidrug transport system fused ATPase/permease subunit
VLVKVAVQKESVEYDDIPGLSDGDSAFILSDRFNLVSRADLTMTLTEKLFALIRSEWLTQAFFQFMGSVSGFIAPLALEKILIYVRYSGGEQYHQEGFLKINIWVAVLMIFMGPVCKSIGDGQNYVRGRHIGIRVKAALIGLIYRKALKIDLSASKESVGMLNNLISVDVGEIQSFCSYSHFMWSTPLEIFLASSLLFVVLGRAAIAGMLVMVIALFIGLVIGKRLEHLQDNMLKNKDKRIAIMHEVLHSIRIIKFYAWEKQFNDKIGMARLQELASLLMYACTNVLLYVIWEIVPSLVGAIAFMTYTQILGKPLTPALGFTAITLFQLLRFPLSVFPEMINLLVKSRISMSRIENFLKTENVIGLPDKEVSQSNVSSTTTSTKETESIVGAIHLQDVSIAWRGVLKTSEDEKTNNEASDEKNGNFCCAMENSGNPFNCCFSGQSSSSRKKKKSTKKSSNSEQEYQLLDKSDHGLELKSMVVGDEEEGEELKYEEFLPNHVMGNEGKKETEDLEESGSSKLKIVLHNLNLYFPPGALVVIIGATGSGKSSLIQGAMLGEAMILGGRRFASGSLSYSSQSAWIQNATVRDNILFGLPYEAERYQAVIHACALKTDLKLLAAGDMTEIGEKGVNLSGGQQQRINLARAAYAQSNIILLDDPLSAVDAHVGDHIFSHLVLDYLSTRTRVLATNNLALSLPHADIIVCMDAQKKCVLAYGSRESIRLQLMQYVNDEESTVVRDNSDNKAFYRGVVQVLDAAVVSTEGDFKNASQETDHANVHRSISREVSDPHAPECAHEVAWIEEQFDKESTALRNSDMHDSEESGAEIDGFLQQDTTQQLSPHPFYAHLTRSFSSMLLFSKQAPPPKFPSQSNVSNPSTTTDSSKAKSVHQGITERETKSTGDVPLSTYWFYLQAAGGLFVTICLITACLWISFSWLIQNYCLGVWMDAMQQPHSPAHPVQLRHYQENVQTTLNRYLFSVVSVIAAYVLRTLFQTFCSIRAAQQIHNSLVRAVLLAPTSWFDATPIGRIINRFSQDISTVDSNVMNHLLDFTDCVLGTISVVCVIASVLPLLLLPLLPVLCFTGWVTFQYLRVSRELKRWESIKKSPVFVLLTETLNGLNTVRAFRQEKRFFRDCCHRIDAMNQCHLYLWISNRWLNFRMQVLGAIVAGAVGAAVVYNAGAHQAGGGHGLGAPAAGLVLLYSLNFCDNLTWLARTHAECQMDMNSVERIEEYSGVESEKYVGESERATALSHGGESSLKQTLRNAVINAERVLSFSELGQTIRKGHADDTSTAASFRSSQQKILQSSEAATSDATTAVVRSGLVQDDRGDKRWPSAGKIEFRGLSMRYKSQLDRPVLQSVSFSVAPCEKIGVVGRTGAGKSSLIVALYRLVEPFAGQILIDDVDILALPLYSIRSNIAIVPQEPTLFKGTLRFNLDPFFEYKDVDIYEALQRVQLCDALGMTPAYKQLQAKIVSSSSSLSGQYDYDAASALEKYLVAEKGGNFSVGQRQLLCMARAILRRAKVLVLDECTASVDHETDALIQDIVRTQLAQTTVLCIAHRLHTVAFYDKVLVMDQGAAKECAAPLQLMQQDGSLFRSLCLSSGAYDQLFVIASEAEGRRKVQ